MVADLNLTRLSRVRFEFHFRSLVCVFAAMTGLLFQATPACIFKLKSCESQFTFKFKRDQEIEVPVTQFQVVQRFLYKSEGGEDLIYGGSDDVRIYVSKI